MKNVVNLKVFLLDSHSIITTFPAAQSCLLGLSS